MRSSFSRAVLAACTLLITVGAAAGVDETKGPQSATVRLASEVNKKLVKLFGSGGFKGLASYGTGVLVSPQGHILTVASHLLDTQELRVHLHDGRRYQAKVLFVEPALDVALIKIDADNLEGLPCFDVSTAARAALAQPGDWVLALSNQFQIATRDEPMSVQKGVIAAYSKLHGRKGVFDAPYNGDVYVIDAIINNPGAGGGVVVTRKGALLGIIGKELRNTLTDTWINYAVPIQVLAEFVDKAAKGEWKALEHKRPEGGGGYHGIVLVPNVVERTPPYIEELDPDSPGARAGLKPDDLIVRVDGEQVASIKAFRDLVSSTRPGTVLKVEILRVRRSPGQNDSKLFTVDIKLEELKAPPRK